MWSRRLAPVMRRAAAFCNDSPHDVVGHYIQKRLAIVQTASGRAIGFLHRHAVDLLRGTVCKIMVLEIMTKTLLVVNLGDLGHHACIKTLH